MYPLVVTKGSLFGCGGGEEGDSVNPGLDLVIWKVTFWYVPKCIFLVGTKGSLFGCQREAHFEWSISNQWSKVTIQCNTHTHTLQSNLNLMNEYSNNEHFSLCLVAFFLSFRREEAIPVHLGKKRQGTSSEVFVIGWKPTGPDPGWPRS